MADAMKKKLAEPNVYRLEEIFQQYNEGLVTFREFSDKVFDELACFPAEHFVKLVERMLKK